MPCTIPTRSYTYQTKIKRRRTGSTLLSLSSFLSAPSCSTLHKRVPLYSTIKMEEDEEDVQYWTAAREKGQRTTTLAVVATVASALTFMEYWLFERGGTTTGTPGTSDQKGAKESTTLLCLITEEPTTTSREICLVLTLSMRKNLRTSSG